MCKLAKKGLPPSAIGVILRDQHGISQVCLPALCALFPMPSYARSPCSARSFLVSAVVNSLSWVAVVQVKSVNGSSILRILKTQGLAPEIPEDLYHLIKKVLPDVALSAAVWMSSELAVCAGLLLGLCSVFWYPQQPLLCVVCGLLVAETHLSLWQAVSMRKHLELNRKDKDGKFRLILVESRIHRLARYYRVRASAAAVQLLPLNITTCILGG